VDNVAASSEDEVAELVAPVVDNVVTSTADDVGEGAIDDLAEGTVDDVAEGTADDVDVADDAVKTIDEGPHNKPNNAIGESNGGAGDFPELEYRRDSFSIAAFDPSNPITRIRAELPSPGVIDVTDISSIALGKGKGASLLSGVLKSSNEIPTRQLRFSNINNPPTLKAYADGINPADSVLGKTGLKTLEELGLEASVLDLRKYEGN
jgi:hypothetical protein